MLERWGNSGAASEKSALNSRNPPSDTPLVMTGSVVQSYSAAPFSRLFDAA
jgi:hypothetical protein